MLVLLILVIVWAAVLGPSLLRRRSERWSRDSIGDFHRQLRVLERTGPVTVDPAHRLGASAAGGSAAGLDSPASDSTTRSGVFVVRPDAAVSPSIPGGRSGRRPDPYFRPEACRRRRTVMMGLLIGIVSTGLLGAVPVLRPLLYLTLAGVVLLMAYVGLLVYLRTLAAEREMKLRYLPAPTDNASTAVGRAAAR